MPISSPVSPPVQLCAQARYRCGFGCIRCGCTIYRYCRMEGGSDEGELFLLCPPCLDRMNGNPDGPGVLAVLLRNPLPRQTGFFRAALPYMRADTIADTHFASGPVLRATAFPIVLDGTALIGMVPPEVDDGPMQLSVTLGGADGQPVNVIQSNVWMAEDGWRFERSNTRYAIAAKIGDACLELTFEPGMVMRIDRLHTRLGFRTLDIDRGGCRVNGEPVPIRSGPSRLVGVRI